MCDCDAVAFDQRQILTRGVELEIGMQLGPGESPVLAGREDDQKLPRTEHHAGRKLPLPEIIGVIG